MAIKRIRLLDGDGLPLLAVAVALTAVYVMLRRGGTPPDVMVFDARSPYLDPCGPEDGTYPRDYQGRCTP